VDTHAHPDHLVVGPGLGGQRSLGRDTSSDGVGRPLEQHEERVTLGADLDPATSRDRLSYQLVVAGQQCAIVVAQGAEQLGGSLDVGEDHTEAALEPRVAQRSPSRVTVQD
jgi:hypothetical protein